MPFTSAKWPRPFVLPPQAPCASRLTCAGARRGVAMIAARASSAAMFREGPTPLEVERIVVSPLVCWPGGGVTEKGDPASSPLCGHDEWRRAESTGDLPEPKHESG